MLSENDERVRLLEFITWYIYIVKMIDDKGLEDEDGNINTNPFHLGAFVVSKKTMNIFIHANIGFLTNDIYFTDSDSLNIEKKH